MTATGTAYGAIYFLPIRAVAVNETNYLIGQQVYAYLENIAAGITDSGYRHGLDVNGAINDANFAGTLLNQTGFFISHGIVAGGGTITSSYALYLQGLNTAGTITNKWGIYQDGATFNNYFAGLVTIGATTGAAKLSVDGGVHVGGVTDPGDNNLTVDGTVVATAGFGCNSKTAQTAYASGGAVDSGTVDATYGASERDVITSLRTIVNNLRSALIANGICS
jgi:hypothetical protein